jgi:hypothetical protein
MNQTLEQVEQSEQSELFELLSDYSKEKQYENALYFGGFRFELTCLACPEQYDVYQGTEQVAYVRLRHGNLRVYHPDAGGELLYHQRFYDDDYKGCFDNDEEANKYLSEIAGAIQEHITGKQSDI